MWVAGDWTDFELLDAGFGEKLERWGPYILRRPDPQAVWPADKSKGLWPAADAVYIRSGNGGGGWECRGEMPAGWDIRYKQLRFRVKPMQFKHTGIFPEQAVNWDWMREMIAGRGAVRVLSLFAYTGAATVAAAAAGASVCHVDAAKGMVAMAKENASLSGVPNGRIRYIVDDAVKFIRREIRRGSKYDAVVMDPPAYGRGPGGELWKSEIHLYEAINLCSQLLSNAPIFFVVNTYTTGISAASVENILRIAVKSRFGGRLECGELGLPVAAQPDGIVLPCGCCARWAPD